ncbi:dirigent protein 22-like [Aristolochia californica]|uniref:dirigent protein 22-like n=1 Tax=Aristolochia californica TaxID=171875 RepID=UPI0035DC196E
MAKFSLFLFFTLSILFFSITAEGQPKSPNSHPVFGNRKEKLSHLHFYYHDILSGPNITAVTVVQPSAANSSATNFGSVIMIDDPLTEGPERSSKLVGRAQGLYTSASLDDVVLFTSMTFAFTTGKYNGSTLSILGRNAVFTGVREMPVVGGTGLFRWARGYSLARTYFSDIKVGNAVLEFDVYVLHY